MRILGLAGAENPLGSPESSRGQAAWVNVDFLEKIAVGLELESLFRNVDFCSYYFNTLQLLLLWTR